MTGQHTDNTLVDLLTFDPNALAAGARVAHQSASHGKIIKPRGDQGLKDCALIEWSHDGTLQWIEHKELAHPREYNRAAYLRIQSAISSDIAKGRHISERLLDAEALAWMGAYGSNEVFGKLHRGIHLDLDRLETEWIAVHRNELGSSQGEICTHRLPGFVVPHRFVVTADPKRFGHVKPIRCSEISCALEFLMERAERDQSSTPDRIQEKVQPIAFLGIRNVEYSAEQYADFIVHDPNKPGRERWINSVPIRGYSSPENEERAVSEMRKLAVPASRAALLREQFARREAAGSESSYEQLRDAERSALRAEFDKLTTDVKARHGAEVSRLLRVAEAACQQPETVHERQNTRARGR